MKPLNIITATSPGGRLPVVFPDDADIPAFELPLISLVDRKVVEKTNKWVEEENAARTSAEPPRPEVTNYELCEYLLPLVIDRALAKKVLARSDGELLQIWDAWLTTQPDSDADLGES